MQNQTPLQKINADKALSVKMNYSDYGILTRKEYIDRAKNDGWKAEISKRPRIYFSRTKFNRLSGAEQAEYERKCDERIDCYVMRSENGNSSLEITKAEYDYYFESLNS